MREFAVALTEALHGPAEQHLLRRDSQEDLCFALYHPTIGKNRWTAILADLILPEEGERDVNGNAAFHSEYIRRALKIAAARGAGLALLHSHPLGRGWQGMSPDDIRAESGHAAVTFAETSLPLVGLTLAGDGAWSARVWWKVKRGDYERRDCSLVRTVGHAMRCSFNRSALAPVNPKQLRTVSFWGEEAQRAFAALHVAIVGLGSVGSIVAETLARMGARHLTLIDPDVVELHNLDRTVGATSKDVGVLKVQVAARHVQAVATARRITIRSAPASVASSAGLKALYDCDVAFSCVDRPLARHTLNGAAYRNLMPVVDGGILVRLDSTSGEFQGANWSVHTAGPERPCLLCRGAYDLESVSLEQTGLLDDPHYIQGLPDSSSLKRRENIFPLSASVASFEVLQLIAMVSALMNLPDLGQQRYSYYPGVVRLEPLELCKADCPFPSLTAIGSTAFPH
jgi:hypothetical protein